jgi:hypothetical protein
MVIYWVAYIRGSFSLKERYVSAEQARGRCNDLLGEAYFIRVVVADHDEPSLLRNCFELPPPGANRCF